jgi:hypothetical protein
MNGKIEAIRKLGLHTFSAFVVDNADVDQTVTQVIGDSIDIVQEIGSIDHPSLWQEIEVNVQEISIAYNYPNPFNPEMETTRFYVPLEDDTPVDLHIFDAFGNLVWEQLGIHASNKSDDAGNNHFLQWHGRNGHGEKVASGTYIAIIKPHNGKAFDPIKIGVLKKN